MSLAKPAINWSHVTGKRHTGEAPPHRCLNRRVPPFSLVTQLRRSKVEIAAFRERGPLRPPTTALIVPQAERHVRMTRLALPPSRPGVS